MLGRIIGIILCLVLGLFTQTQAQNIAETVRRANVSYSLNFFQRGIPHVPPLISNGILGACFDHMGFQSRPKYGEPQGRTVIGYVDQYDRHESSRQITFPLAVMQARFADGTDVLNLMDMTQYRQELDIYHGVLETKYDLFGETKITALAHQTVPNLMLFKVDRKADEVGKNIVLEFLCETSEIQNNHFLWPVDPVELSFELSADKKSLSISSQTDLGNTEWVLEGNNEIELEGDKVKIALREEENLLKLWVKREDCPGKAGIARAYETLIAEHTAAWEKVWKTSWIDFPEDRAHKIWTRSKYYGVSHFPLISEKAMMPTGLNGNIWGFTFPQDVYFMAENLPRLGLQDRSRKALKYWLDILPEVQDYTQRIMEVEGAFYPWTPPFTDWESYEKEGVVSPDSYELHNPAYVAAMVWHYYQVNQDQEFLRQYFPIIEEVARFYKNISEKNAQGTYDIYHINARGQDEASTTDGKLRNLLCASYSAEYSFRIFQAALSEVEKREGKLARQIKEILNTGLAREQLLRAEGMYQTYNRDIRPMGMQKHPVQLNPIAYVPMPDLVAKGSPVAKAWQLCYQLTQRANKPITLGWTIGEFALASCRMQDPLALEKDLRAIQPCRSADPDWIQFYESSFWQGWHMNKSYYLPMMGLYLQTFTDALVQDWQGYVEIFPCLLPAWETERIAFEGLHSRQGVHVSGSWYQGKFKLKLQGRAGHKVPVKVGRPVDKIRAYGQKEGPTSFAGEELVSFTFAEGQAIIIEY